MAIIRYIVTFEIDPVDADGRDPQALTDGYCDLLADTVYTDNMATGTTVEVEIERMRDA